MILLGRNKKRRVSLKVSVSPSSYTLPCLLRTVRLRHFLRPCRSHTWTATIKKPQRSVKMLRYWSLRGYWGLLFSPPGVGGHLFPWQRPSGLEWAKVHSAPDVQRRNKSLKPNSTTPKSNVSFYSLFKTVLQQSPHSDVTLPHNCSKQRRDFKLLLSSSSTPKCQAGFFMFISTTKIVTLRNG